MRLTKTDISEVTASLRALYEPITMLGYHAEHEQCVPDFTTLQVLNDLRLVISRLEEAAEREAAE